MGSLESPAVSLGACVPYRPVVIEFQFTGYGLLPVQDAEPAEGGGLAAEFYVTGLFIHE